MTESRYRRRQLFVNPELQKSIVKRVVTPAIASLVVAAVLVTWFAKQVHDHAGAAATGIPSLVTVLLIAAFFVFFAGGLMIYHALTLSHQVAGPAYRIRSDVERVLCGDTAHRVRLRDGDLLHDVADDVNTLLEWVEQRVELQASNDVGAPSKHEDAPAEPALVD